LDRLKTPTGDGENRVRYDVAQSIKNLHVKMTMVPQAMQSKTGGFMNGSNLTYAI